MYGRGVFNFPPLADGFRPNLGYNLMAVGVGADYKVRPYLVVRADWEYQRWFGFQNSSLSPKHPHYRRRIPIPGAQQRVSPGIAGLFWLTVLGFP